jgi:hypothetical protein
MKEGRLSVIHPGKVFRWHLTTGALSVGSEKHFSLTWQQHPCMKKNLKQDLLR